MVEEPGRGETGEALVQVSEFEKRVWEVDHLRLVIRAPATAVVQDFVRVNAADQGMRLTEYLSTRIKPLIGPYEAAVVRGDGAPTHGGAVLRTLRETYD
jgi:hypothetical protein